MKLAFFSGEHPHDDVRAIARHLRVHSKGENHRCLLAFFEEATVAVKDEIRSLPHDVQALVPSIEHVLDLVEYSPLLQNGPLAEPVERASLCVLKFGALIGHYELDPSSYDFNQTESCLLGLGVGVSVAAAVSLSPTIWELPARGAEVVRLVFRCAFHVDRVARSLDTFDPDASSNNWIYVILNEREQLVRDKLEAAQPDHSTPNSSKIFICNARPLGISVCGPPSRLRRLFEEDDFFRKSNHIRMPCYGGPIHANHMFDEGDVSSIVKKIRDSPTSVKAQVISPGNGTPFVAATSTELFTRIITYLLTEEVCWEKVVTYAVKWVKDQGGDSHQICAFRSAQQVQDVVNAVQSGIRGVHVSTVDWLQWVFASPQSHVRPSGPLQSKIAIVGMSCRFPGGANDIDKYWNLLESGRDVHQEVPPDRFNIETHFDPTGQKTNATLTPYGCFVENPGLFDPAFFNMSPREAEQTDPMQRLALVTAYEALEHAGFVNHPSVDMRRIGTFYGQSSDDYREVNSAQDISTYWISGGCRAFGPGRINYFLGFSGPSFSCDTACSSSLATIQMACTSLWSGDTDMVVAGGMNILTNPDGFAGLSRGFFLSNTGNCKTWDRNADGYCRADGVGSVVMKRLEDALANNDNILGVVAAAATNHSAEAISITHPHSGTQADLFRQVTARAGLDPLDVGYVELHGTGTQAGDSNELSSVTEVFAPLKQSRKHDQALYIGAAKANVGHGEAAAGIISLIKTLCVLQKEAIPPHVGVKNGLTPHFPQDSQERNMHIPFQRKSWRRSPDRKRIAIVNNFGAAGGNTTFVIEEAPERQIYKADPRSTHAIVVSAKNKISLRRNIERLLGYVRKTPATELQDLAYTLAARRYHYNHRVGFAVSNISELEKSFAPYLVEDPPVQQVRTHAPPIAFAFTGQGSFYSSMASQLFKDAPPFRNKILHFDKLAQRQGFDSIIPVLEGTDIDQSEFSLTVIHLSIVCVEMALFNYWEELGVKPSIVIGHSIGEVPALYAAGVLCANDAIFLVGQRAMLLARLTKAGAYSMLAVRCNLETASEVAQTTGCDIACINGPEDIVIAGSTEALSSATDHFSAKGNKTTALELTQGYHSQQMDCILEDYERVAEGVIFHKPRIPVISPLLSEVVTDSGIFNASYMRRATREAVNFIGALQVAEEANSINDKTIWLELGPHPLCCSFVRKSVKQVGLALPSLRKKENNWATISQTLCQLHCGGITIDWKELHRPYEKSLKLLELPTYAFNNKNYWIPYVGDWALLKGNMTPTRSDSSETLAWSLPLELKTNSIHGLVEESYDDDDGAKIVVETNILDPNVIEAVNGHAMNGYGVVSCMVHGEIAYTLAKYLYKKVRDEDAEVSMNLQNFEYHEPVVARKSTENKQMIHTEATLEPESNVVKFRWYNVESDQWYSYASITYEDSNDWLADWSRTTHLINSRIEALQGAAEDGRANKLSRQLAYRLFANLVDWSEPFQGMQSVVLDRMEAFADVKLSMNDHGKWYTPPWYMESLVALSAFVLNCSEVMDNKNNFFITPGFKTMRFAKPLKAGARYTSYVKMMSMGKPNMYAGDVYILDGSEVVAVMEKIMFRSWPRVMLKRFFAAPDAKNAITGKPKANGDDATKPNKLASLRDASHVKSNSNKSHLANGHGLTQHEEIHSKPIPKSVATTKKAKSVTSSGRNSPRPRMKTHHDEPVPDKLHNAGISNGFDEKQNEFDAPNGTHETNGTNGTNGTNETAAPPKQNGDAAPKINKKNGLVTRALAIIADEAGIEVSDLDEQAEFGNLGIDSLMSLVLAQKFRSEIGVEVRDSLFIEFPCVGDLCRWLEKQ